MRICRKRNNNKENIQERAAKLQANIEMLEGLIYAAEHIEKVFEIAIMASDSMEMRRLFQMEFQMTELQAQLIMDARIRAFSRNELDRVRREIVDLTVKNNQYLDS